MATAKMDIDQKKCLTHEFRVSFPNVFEPKAYQDQEPKYSVVMLFPKKTDLSKPAGKQKNSLKQIAFNAAVEKWGSDKAKWPKNLRLPFRDGDEKTDSQGYEGHIFVSASSKTRPGVVDQYLKPIINKEDFYAGCYARAEVIAFAYDTMGNKGIGFALQNLQKLRDGEPFSGKRKAEDVFEAVETDSDNPDNYSDDSANLGF